MKANLSSILNDEQLLSLALAVEESNDYPITRDDEESYLSDITGQVIVGYCLINRDNSISLTEQASRLIGDHVCERLINDGLVEAVFDDGEIKYVTTKDGDALSKIIKESK